MIANILKDNMIHNEKSIFSKIEIYLHDIPRNIFQIMECLIFFGCNSTKFCTTKWKDKYNNNKNNNSMDSGYLILFLLTDNIDENNMAFIDQTIILITYNKRNIFSKILIYFVVASLLRDIIVLSLIILTVRDLYNEYLCMNKLIIRCKWIKIYNLKNIVDLYDVIVFILIVMECIVFFNCDNTKFGKIKCKDENNNNNNKNKNNRANRDNNMCKDARNEYILNIYQLNNDLNLNISQYISIYNTRNIFLKILTYFVFTSLFISIIMIVHGLYGYYLCMNTLFNWYKWTKHKYTVNKDNGESRNNNNNTKIIT